MNNKARQQWFEDNREFLSQIEDKELRNLYRKYEEKMKREDITTAISTWDLIYENLFRTYEDLLKERREILSMKNIPRKEMNEVMEGITETVTAYRGLLRKCDSHKERLRSLADDKNHKEEA